MSEHRTPPQTEAPGDPDARRVAADVPIHDAKQLTAGGLSAYIVLEGQPYILRITRAGKLILTK
ncbi:hemin uptake protein HemP [Roseicitreum antarcticum]|nr:hemin uptake protein HemP [Roseicitreum antarcticum]